MLLKQLETQKDGSVHIAWLWFPNLIAVEEHENLVNFKVKFRGKNHKDKIGSNGAFPSAHAYFWTRIESCTMGKSKVFSQEP